MKSYLTHLSPPSDSTPTDKQETTLGFTHEFKNKLINDYGYITLLQSYEGRSENSLQQEFTPEQDNRLCSIMCQMTPRERDTMFGSIPKGNVRNITLFNYLRQIYVHKPRRTAQEFIDLLPHIQGRDYRNLSLQTYFSHLQAHNPQETQKALTHPALSPEEHSLIQEIIEKNAPIPCE